jgi:hypothetical protein
MVLALIWFCFELELELHTQISLEKLASVEWIDADITIPTGTQKNAEPDGDGPFGNLTKSLRLFRKKLKTSTASA